MRKYLDSKRPEQVGDGQRRGARLGEEEGKKAHNPEKERVHPHGTDFQSTPVALMPRSRNPTYPDVDPGFRRVATFPNACAEFILPAGGEEQSQVQPSKSVICELAES